MEKLTIIHFNDVYNIEPQTDEPAGGAARFSAYVKSIHDLNPLVLFSGDALNPSLMSIFLRGKQMIPIFNGIGVHCAVFGNHDFDFGVDHLEKCIEKMDFPWLLSNIKDNINDEPLGKGEVTHMIEHAGYRIGLIGMVEEEWIETLSIVDQEDITYLDFVDESRRLANELREQGADMVIALTHMRWPNDEKMAAEVPEIDIVLGGHDHDYGIKEINGKIVLKSGTDFRNLSKLTATMSSTAWSFEVERVDLNSEYPEDPEMVEIVKSMSVLVGSKMDTYLGSLGVSLDGRFSSVRLQETNLGNFLCDIMLEATEAEVALLNSGTLRSDRIHCKGEFKIRDLLSILPFPDLLVVIEVTGQQLLEALENGVSQYPKMEGRFPQVGGIIFGFDPQKKSGHRIDMNCVKVQGKSLSLNRNYRVVTKEYVANGCDGYDVFKLGKVLLNSEQCPALSTAVQNHFESVAFFKGRRECRSGHRQSLVPLVQKNKLMRRASLEHPDQPRRLVRQMSIHDAEIESTFLSPQVEGRIYLINEEQLKCMADMVPPTVLHHKPEYHQ